MLGHITVIQLGSVNCETAVVQVTHDVYSRSCRAAAALGSLLSRETASFVPTAALYRPADRPNAR